MKWKLPQGKAAYFFTEARENKHKPTDPKKYSGNLILDPSEPEVLSFMDKVRKILQDVKEKRAIEEINGAKLSPKAKQEMIAAVSLVEPWREELDQDQNPTGRVILPVRRKESDGKPQFIQWNKGPDGKPVPYTGASIEPGALIEVIAEANPNYMFASNKVYCTFKLCAVRCKPADASEFFSWDDDESTTEDQPVVTGVDGSEF